MDGGSKLHIAMFPWFAMGHLTSFLHISNKLAAKGHRVSFLIPIKTQSKLNTFNLHPHLIHFIPLGVPHVDGLPSGSETTADVPFPLHPVLMTAMDQTETAVEAILLELKPDFVFFDFTHWLPALTRRLGIKSILYCIISSATIAYSLSPERIQEEVQGSEPDLTHPPLGFPPSAVKLHVHEARASAFFRKREFGSGILFHNRQMISLNECDAIAFKSCREMEGPFCDYLESQFKKPILLSGPVIPEPPTSTLDERWVKWLGGFKEGSVIYCALGSQSNLKKDQFMELVLGLELTGLPFLAALKPPTEDKSIEEELPEGFAERVEGMGVVEGGWVQQQLILAHPSVGCFVTHCGSGSLTEALVNDCQIVLLPQYGDQIVNARLMGGDLRAGVEVERGEEDGKFTKESVCNAVRLVMDQDNEVAKEVRSNHAKWKDFLLRDGLESSYIDDFIKKLQDLLG
ncbi:UDP-glucuronosyl/UDP-glucosyltransferase [Macleaya cordata]|uniref:Glycosyltransferase n=1 Tax=Macleaya cordata TaxID=56857 RepID=A0A200QYX7_MACCD|nr:UDP-glucuronosyl/UDP-glucosyltransferase [Macleaya cordata]